MVMENSAVLEYLGQNTMPILLYHKYLILLCQTVIPVLKTWLKSPDSIRGVIAALFTALAAVMLCCLGGSFMKKHVPCSIGSIRREE